MFIHSSKYASVAIMRVAMFLLVCALSFNPTSAARMNASPSNLGSLKVSAAELSPHIIISSSALSASQPQLVSTTQPIHSAQVEDAAGSPTSFKLTKDVAQSALPIAVTQTPANSVITQSEMTTPVVLQGAQPIVQSSQLGAQTSGVVPTVAATQADLVGTPPPAGSQGTIRIVLQGVTEPISPGPGTSPAQAVEAAMIRNNAVLTLTGAPAPAGAPDSQPVLVQGYSGLQSPTNLVSSTGQAKQTVPAEVQQPSVVVRSLTDASQPTSQRVVLLFQNSGQPASMPPVAIPVLSATVVTAAPSLQTPSVGPPVVSEASNGGALPTISDLAPPVLATSRLSMAWTAFIHSSGFIIFVKSACMISNVVFQVSPLPQVQQWISQSTTGQADPLPFFAIALGGWQWCFYGVFAWLVTQRTGFLILVHSNCLGALLGTYYAWCFKKHCQNSVALESLWWCGNAALGLVILQLVAILMLPIQTCLFMSGIIASVCSVASGLSVLTSVPTVLKEKKSDSIPGALVLASFISAFMWFICGIMLADPCILIPNFVSITAASVCLFLKVKYPSGDVARPAKHQSCASFAALKMGEAKSFHANMDEEQLATSAAGQSGVAKALLASSNGGVGSKVCLTAFGFPHSEMEDVELPSQ